MREKNIYKMTKLMLSFCLLVQLISIAASSQQPIHNETQSNKTNTNPAQQIDPERLEEINFVINSYFPNCSIDAQQQVLYGCSIKRENYPQFLYGLFHKQHIMNFLKLYQLQGKLETQKEIQQMYKVGEKVRNLVVSAYQDWVEVYKPNPQISVQQMYGDIPDLDRQVLDIIQHNQAKHQDFISVLRQISKIQTTAVRYIVMGNKTEEQIAQDYAGMLEVYFGDCQPVTQCKISIPAFVYFVKELAFYITPLIDQQMNKESILVGNDMDFRATEFLTQEIQKMKPIIGETVEYSELEQYSQQLATNLFQYLKNNSPQPQSPTVNQVSQFNVSRKTQQNYKQEL